MRLSPLSLVLAATLMVGIGCRKQKPGDGASAQGSAPLLPGTCEEAPTDCDLNADCVTVGSEHRCDCRPGFAGDGTACQWVPAPDCSVRGGDCALGASCTDTPQGPQCACPSGEVEFKGRCQKPNPCTQGTCLGRCVEVFGYECVCDSPLKPTADGNCALCVPACDPTKGERCMNKDGSEIHWSGDHTDWFWCQCASGWGKGADDACEFTCAPGYCGAYSVCGRMPYRQSDWCERDPNVGVPSSKFGAACTGGGAECTDCWTLGSTSMCTRFDCQSDDDCGDAEGSRCIANRNGRNSLCAPKCDPTQPGSCGRADLTCQTHEGKSVCLPDCRLPGNGCLWPGTSCQPDGTCSPVTPCTSETGAGCSTGDVCVDGSCVPDCRLSSGACGAGETCEADGRCRFQLRKDTESCVSGDECERLACVVMPGQPGRCLQRCGHTDQMGANCYTKETGRECALANAAGEAFCTKP